MDPIDLELVLRSLDGATLAGDADFGTLFESVSTDSRTAGPGALFFALRGERFDGQLFVEEAFARGASGAVARIRGPLPASEKVRGRPLILVADPGRALLKLAGEYRRALEERFRVAAITGSCGKTTVREMVYHLVCGRFRAAVRSEKSFNNAVGVPATLFRCGAATELAIVEIGTGGAGEIAPLARAARPDVAAVLNVRPVHLEGLKDLAGVAREKAAIVEQTSSRGRIVLSHDDPATLAMAALAGPRRVLTFGFTKGSDVQGEYDPSTRQLAVRYEDREAAVVLPFPGRHNAENALAALAIAAALDEDPIALAPRLATFALPARRLERFRAPGEVEIVDDAYNANPASTRAAIDVLVAEPVAAPGGRRVLVFGGMAELGAEHERRHREVGETVAAADPPVDIFAAIGDAAGIAAEAAILAGFPAERALRFPDRDAAADVLAGAILAPGDLVLVKASHAAGLDRFIADLIARLQRRFASSRSSDRIPR